MNAKCMVTADVTAPWEFDGKSGVSRILTLVDQDPEHRMIPAFQCRIDVKDPVAGDGNQGASIKDCLVDLAVTDINQKDHNKRLLFSGRVLRIHGIMKMQPWQPTPEKKAA